MNETTIGLAPYCGPRRRLCSVEGCEKTRFCKGLCEVHYSRFRRHGNPLVCVHNRDRRHIKLNETKVAEIMKMRESGLTQTAIAKVFNVDRTTVGKAIAGVNWKGVAA